MLKDTKPGEEEQFITGGVPAVGAKEEDTTPEPAPPEPFEYLG